MSDEHDDAVAVAAQPSSRPQPRDVLAALGTLTALPLPRPAPGSEAFGRAALFFPVAGLLMGALLLGLYWLMVGRLPAWWAALGVAAVWEAVSGPPLLRAHELGGAAGLALLGVLVAAKTACTAAVRPAGLLFAPLLARWALVVLATGVRDAAAPTRKFNPAITFREFALASVFTFAVVFAVADAFGVLLVVSVAAVTLGLRLLAHRVGGGVSWRFLLASAEGLELLVLVLCTIL